MKKKQPACARHLCWLSATIIKNSRWVLACSMMGCFLFSCSSTWTTDWGLQGPIVSGLGACFKGVSQKHAEHIACKAYGLRGQGLVPKGVFEKGWSRKKHQAIVVLSRGQKAGDYLPRHVGKCVVQGLPNLVGLVFSSNQGRRNSI